MLIRVIFPELDREFSEDMNAHKPAVKIWLGEIEK